MAAHGSFDGVLRRLAPRIEDRIERGLVPPQQWRGPLAFPNFFRDAKRARGDEFEWSLQYPSDRIELVVGYRLEAGHGILGVTHTTPPDPVRD